MVLSTDVANHFKNLDVLKTVTPKTFMDEKDSMVLKPLFSSSFSNSFTLVISAILAWTLITILAGELWLVFSLIKLPPKKRSWVSK